MAGARLTRRDFLRCSVASGVALHGCLGLRERPPGVVCVLVDQLRKDVADRRLVSVNRLAERGVVVSDMRAVAPWTYPSVVSLFSGLHPQQHGADGHIRDDTLTTFDAGVPLVHHALGKAGWATAAFITNPFLHEWNPFHRGFDVFEASFVGHAGNARNFPRAVWKPERMFGDSVNAAILGHFRRRPVGPPEFTYVHYIDVHGPWDGAPFAADYDAAVAFVDARIAELHRFFSERYDGDLLFLVTADHGAALGDDEHAGLGLPWRASKLSPFDFNLRIPFAVLPGRRVPEGRMVAGSCSNVDVVPTLLDWLGVHDGHPRPGRSLLAAIRDDVPLRAGRAIYAKVSAFGHRSDCVVMGDRKYVRFFEPESGRLLRRHVFDVTRDPRETASVATGFDPEVDATLAAVAGTHGVAYAARFDPPSDEVRARLRALGYLQ